MQLWTISAEISRYALGLDRNKGDNHLTLVLK